ncbi:MAG: hypothetical protein NTY30_01015 [Candidatus Berkelbacteria bacterium]|nr:hypothetical protein [Candidatus Berkelbacteria bacterium]
MLRRSLPPKKRSVDGLTRKSMERDSSFFADLDKAKNKFSGFWSVAIIILLVIFIGLIIAAISLKRSNISIANPAETSGNLNLSFADRLSSINSLGMTTLEFSGQEFVAASGASSSDFPIKDPEFILSKDNILLTGKIRDSWIPISVKVKIDAAAVDGKATFIVVPNDLENIIVYGSNKDKIESTFNQNINQVLKNKNMIAKSLSVSDDRIEFQVVKLAK